MIGGRSRLNKQHVRRLWTTPTRSSVWSSFELFESPGSGFNFKGRWRSFGEATNLRRITCNILPQSCAYAIKASP